MTKYKCCKLCGSKNINDFFNLLPVPTQDGNMAMTEIAALNVVKGTLNLRFCNVCGFIRNEDYDATKVNFDKYDFSNDHSPLFQDFVNILADRLIYEYRLKDKFILDIGCGDGVFLQTICKKGNNKGIGIDPGFDHSKRKTMENIDVSFIQEYYSKAHTSLKPDFVVCRLVLDILENPTDFLSMIRRNLNFNPETILYFEVPNALYTFKEKVIWNVIYEHASWYTPDSLTLQFESCGFEVLNIAPCWNDEFLGIEVRCKPPTYAYLLSIHKNVESFSKIITNFEEDFQYLKAKSNHKIEQIKQEEIKTIAWGAGARAVTFFNLLDIREDVPFIVDVNIKRHGKYLPGSGQKIVPPDFILEYAPDLILITNPTYTEEIKNQVYKLGLNPNFWVL